MDNGKSTLQNRLDLPRIHVHKIKPRVYLTSCATRAKSPFLHAQVLVEHFIASGIDGFYVAGSTGEGFTMTVDERMVLTAEVTNLRPKSKVLNMTTTNREL